MALLDENHAGWDAAIAPDRLDLLSCTQCVLGQVFGRYHAGCKQLDLDNDSVADFGFASSRRVNLAPATQRTELTAEWRRVVEQRRAA
ncbi:MAG TPA: hypothetical protein VGB97_03820 [Candidatus Paceibacterota bacterium]|jgi:hypothetical protein